MGRLFRFAPVRIAAQALLMVALGVLPIVLVAEPLSALGLDDRTINMIIGPLLTAAIVGSVVIAARYFDRRPLRDYGLVLDRRAFSGLLLGISVSAVVMSLVFAAEWLAGWITITGFALPLAFTLMKVICVGIYEEVYTRGYLLRNIADATSLPVAVIVTSALFALLHALSPNATPGGIAALFANGLGSPPATSSPAASRPRSACTPPGTLSRARCSVFR